MYTIFKCVFESDRLLENTWVRIKLMKMTKELSGEINADSISFQLSSDSNPSAHFSEVAKNLAKCLIIVSDSFSTDRGNAYFEIDTAIEPEDISGRNMLTWTLPNSLHDLVKKNSIRLTTTIYP